MGIKRQERQDRAAVNARRDRRLAAIAADEAGLAIKLERQWLSEEQVQRERERLAQLREAVQEVAKRERQIVSYQARRRIDAKLRSTFRDAIAAATGVDARAADFVAAFVRGENPLEAAMAAALSEPSEDPRQGFRDLRDRLREVQKAAAAMSGVQTIALRERLAQALREANGLAEGDGPPPDDQITRFQELSEALGRASQELSAFTKELFPDSPRIAPERFANDQRWIAMNWDEEQLDAPQAKQALTSAILRRSADRTVDIMEQQDITLTEDQIKAIASEVLSGWIDWRSGDGQAGEPFDVDTAVWTAINDIRRGVGLDPLPPPGDAGAAATEPVKRHFKGTATITFTYFEREDAQCEITFPVDIDMTLETDGTGGIFVSDSPQTRGTPDGVECFAQGKPRIYGGPWSVEGDPSPPRSVTESRASPSS